MESNHDPQLRRLLHYPLCYGDIIFPDDGRIPGGGLTVNHDTLHHMSALGTYRRGFSLALSRELVYRVNFLLGRVREFILFAGFLFLFRAIPEGFNGYSSEEAIRYILISACLSAPLFTYGMHSIANEIVDGDLANYLLRPMNYFAYWTSRLLATRTLLIFGGIFQVALLILLFGQDLSLIQTKALPLIQCGILFLGSLALVQLIDFTGGLLSFWTNRGHGPRWLMTVLIQFLSGAYIPIDLLPHPIKQALLLTPFPSLLYGPIKAYLGKLSHPEFTSLLFTQLIWIILFTLLVSHLWKKGVRNYGAYGR